MNKYTDVRSFYGKTGKLRRKIANYTPASPAFLNTVLVLGVAAVVSIAALSLGVLS